MTTPTLEWVVWTVAIVVLYGGLSRGLFLLTDPARQSLVDIGGGLLDDPRFPESEKSTVLSQLDMAHSARWAWLVALITIRIFLKRLIGWQRPAVSSPVPPMLHGIYDEFDKKWLFATIGNSLAACFIFVIAVLGIATLKISFQALTRALVATIHREDRGQHQEAAAAH